MIQSTAKEAIKGIDWEVRVTDTITDTSRVCQAVTVCAETQTLQCKKPDHILQDRRAMLGLGAGPAMEVSMRMWT